MPKSEGQGLTLGVCWNLIGHDGKISSVAGLGPKKAAVTGDADDQNKWYKNKEADASARKETYSFLL